MSPPKCSAPLHPLSTCQNSRDMLRAVASLLMASTAAGSGAGPQPTTYCREEPLPEGYSYGYFVPGICAEVVLSRAQINEYKSQRKTLLQISSLSKHQYLDICLNLSRNIYHTIHFYFCAAK